MRLFHLGVDHAVVAPRSRVSRTPVEGELRASIAFSDEYTRPRTSSDVGRGYCHGPTLVTGGQHRLISGAYTDVCPERLHKGEPDNNIVVPQKVSASITGAAHLGIKTEVGTGPAGPRTRTCGRRPVRSADRALDRTARVVSQWNRKWRRPCANPSQQRSQHIENVYWATHAFGGGADCNDRTRTIPIAD